MSEGKKAPVPNIGQWWGVSRSIGGLDGAENVRRLTEDDWASFDLLDATDVAYWISGLSASARHAVYLGDGKQPEPTPWMVEQLAGLLWEMSGTHVPWAQSGCVDHYRMKARAVLVSDGDFKGRALRHMHAVLRSLGYA